MLVALIFVIAGGAMIFFGVRSFLGTNSFLKIAKPSMGEVIGFDSRIINTKGNSRTSYFPKIKFVDAKGTEVEFVSSSGSSSPDVSIGDKVPILYNPEHPNEARRNNFLDLWFLTTILSAMGLVFLLVGIAIYFKKISFVKIGDSANPDGASPQIINSI